MYERVWGWKCGQEVQVSLVVRMLSGSADLSSCRCRRTSFQPVALPRGMSEPLAHRPTAEVS